MPKLVDKLILFFISVALYVTCVNNKYMIAPILIALIFSASISYFESYGIKIALSAVYLATCLFKPEFAFFIPAICYDIVFSKVKWIWALAFIPLIGIPTDTIKYSKFMTAALIIVTLILKRRTEALESIKNKYHTLQDNAKEISIQLENKNKGLMEKQDYEINLATLKERNRIARDIHDNVGHLLSRSILQIGALLALNKDQDTMESLLLVKESLSEAMSSIRSSVHDLHEESIDLAVEIQKLIDGFQFCNVKFYHDLDSVLNKNIKYCFISVTKESLSNIIKHSNATEAQISIFEHPSLVQLVIQDNGSKICYKSENGIGLKNIKDRVSAIGGNINITTEKGFRVFISVPKG